MRTDFSLLLYNPILSSYFGRALDLGPVPTWRRSIRAMGGPWQGSFSFPERFSADMVDLFYEILGYHLVERSPAGETWVGMIYELELSHNGITLRRSLDLMENAIEVYYSDDSKVAALGFSEQAQSVARYGRKEQILSYDEIPSGTASALQARALAGRAWPWARPVSLGSVEAPALRVKVCGYVFSANWLYVAQGDGTEHDLDHWIEAVVGSAEGLSSDHGGSTSGAGDCQYITAGTIDSNTLQIKESIEGDLRPWSLISQIAGLGDSSGDPWLAWVDLDRRLNYREANLDPAYYMQNGSLGLIGGSPVSDWELWPGVVRNLGSPVMVAEPGSMLADIRDVWVDEIELGADGSLSLKTGLFDESAIYDAQVAQEQENRESGGEL